MAGEIAAQSFDHALHVFPEHLALSGGQADQSRLVRVLEIVQIDQVRRSGGGAGLGQEKVFDEVGPAQSGFAGDIYVVFQARDGQGHLQGLAGPVLEEADGVDVVADVRAAQDSSGVGLYGEMADFEFGSVFHRCSVRGIPRLLILCGHSANEGGLQAGPGESRAPRASGSRGRRTTGRRIRFC
ncbi:hypothetical protein DSECCO2_533830 [anaerobic digester metagenome]